MVMETVVVIVMLALAAAFLWLAFGRNRPSAERFIMVNGLDASATTLARVTAVLDRSRRARRAGALAGGALGFATSVANGWIFGLGGIVFGLLAGTLVGIASAAVPRDEAPAAATHAGLTPRDPADYGPAHPARIVTLLAVGVAATTAVAVLTAPNGLGVTFVLFAFALATLAAIPYGHRARRRTIEARRDDLEPAAVRVDDALRGCTVRGIHHATLGLLCCGLLLAAYGLVATQVAPDVVVDGRSALDLPPLTSDASSVPAPLTQAEPVRWRVEWTPPANTTETRIFHGRSVQIVSDGTGVLIGTGFWLGLVGLAGALSQYGEAAKAWRRPQRTPTAPSETRGATA